MKEIALQDAEAVGGGLGWIAGYVLGQAVTATLSYLGRVVMAGEVDYASIAESQGSGYNTVGA